MHEECFESQSAPAQKAMISAKTLDYGGHESPSTCPRVPRGSAHAQGSCFDKAACLNAGVALWTLPAICPLSYSAPAWAKKTAP